MCSALWHLYLIRTASGMLYTGITTDVQWRLGQHQCGGGAKSLRGKGPLTLVFQSPAGDRSRALRWEYRVKQLSRAQKERFVALQDQALERFGLLSGEGHPRPLDENPLAPATPTPAPGAQPVAAKAARPG